MSQQTYNSWFARGAAKVWWRLNRKQHNSLRLRGLWLHIRGGTFVCFVTITFVAHASAAYFTGLGQLFGPESSATSVSADGSVVVGSASILRPGSIYDYVAFRWSQSTDIDPLEVAPEGDSSHAYDISTDGTVIVGSRNPAIGPENGFRWTGTTGMVELGTGPAYGVSADGSVVVGENQGSAFRWTEGTGAVGLGSGVAHDVSADGSVVVGSSPGGAFRWTQSTGMVAIGGDTANAVSADGSIVVGRNGAEAFRWTQGTGMVGLGILPGKTFSSALGISADGSIIVGHSGNAAFIWDAANGMRPLQDVLVNDFGLGSSFSNWQLVSATGISPDGRTIVGSGFHYQYLSVGWIARLLLPPTLPGDYNGNEVVDAADYVAWRNSLGQTGSGLAADGNVDGIVSSGDYDVWKSHFGKTGETLSSLSIAAVPTTTPEPCAWMLLVFAVLVSSLHRGNLRRRIPI